MMIRNVDLDKPVPVKHILAVLEAYYPREQTKTFRNPEGFGGHYEIDNEDIIDIELVVEQMIIRSEAAWR